MARNNRRRIDRIEVAANDTTIVGHAGLASFIQWAEHRAVFQLAAARLPGPGSNGYAVEDLLKTLWAALLLRGRRTVLQTIDDLRQNRGVVAILGMTSMPSACTMADWLRRLGNVELRHNGDQPALGGWPDGLTCTQNYFYEMTTHILRALAATLSGTLDFDAMLIEEEKKYSQTSYTGERGSMGYFAFVDNVCVMAEVEPGNHSPKDNVAARVTSCLDVCDIAGKHIKAMRQDSAGYTAETVNVCAARHVHFFIRAPYDYVTESVRAIPANDWTAYELGMAHEHTRTAVLAETAHAMNKSKNGFRLLVERRQETIEDIHEDAGLLISVPRVVTRYWSVATNDHTIPLAAALAFYNQRQGASEHGNDHLKNDVAIGALPCRGEDGLPANRVYTYFCALLHNLYEWYKHDCLPPEDKPMRLPTFIQRDLALAARVTLTAHTLTITLANYACAAAEALQRRLDRIRRKIKRIHIPLIAPAFAPLIHRRI